MRVAAVVRLGQASIALLLGLAGLARAQDDAVRIDYHAPGQCVDAAAFLHEALSRSNYGRLAGRRQMAIEMRVSITIEEGDTVGRLEFTDVNRQPVVREVRATTCDELLPGLALATGLAIDAQMAEHQSTESSQPTPVAVPPTTEAGPRGSVPRESATRPNPVRSRRAPSHRPKPKRSSTRPKDHRAKGARAERSPAHPAQPAARWLLGAQGTTASAVAPDNAWGVAAFAGTTSDAVDWSARITAAYAVSAKQARFDWLALRADFCPVSLHLHPLIGSPCIAIEGGTVRAAGRRNDTIVNTRAEWDAWAAVTLLTRFQVLLGQTLFAEVEGGAVGPLVRQTYQYERPEVVVHKTPAVGWTASAGLGVRIW
jgi:hypothetical protein